TPAELVEGVEQVWEGFWASAARTAAGRRGPVVVRLAAGQKQPFDLLLTATVPVEAGNSAAPVALPRFPGAFEREASVTATVPDGLEVRGEVRGWDGEFAAWGEPLAPTPGADGRPTRVATTATAKSESGIARVLLSWSPHRPNLVADVKADVVLGERQLEVSQRMTLRSPDGFPAELRLRAPAGAAGVRGQPALTPSGAEWLLPVATDAKEVTLVVSFAVPLPPRPSDADAAWPVPVALVWPAGARRADVTVRVWSSASASRTVSTASAGWRELAPEPAPDRDTLPALSVAASGGELPLVLEVRETSNPAVVTVWIDRGLVQAWAGGEAATEYRARFLLARWLAPAVEVRLPGPLAGPNPEFRIDGLRANATPLPESSVGARAYRVPLPAAGKPVALEVRYQLPAAAGRAGEAVYRPPTLPTAAFTGPLRWQVTLPSGTVPLHTNGGTPEFRWQFSPTGLSPAPVGTAEGLERWLQTGDEPAAGGAAAVETLTTRQSTPGPVRVYRVPRTGLLILCSVVAFVAVLAASQLPGRWLGPVVAVVACVAGVGAVFFPHPAATALGASQPGFAGAALVLVALGLARLAYHRRVTRLPGFSRTAPEPVEELQPLPSSARKRPSAVGSAPATPAGG
ncbi:MAG TPA: hypothetical protein VM529_19910, partial [Gemmata sp.]|nr:hypothetical protein [Gemmata sp.]